MQQMVSVHQQSPPHHARIKKEVEEEDISFCPV